VKKCIESEGKVEKGKGERKDRKRRKRRREREWKSRGEVGEEEEWRER